MLTAPTPETSPEPLSLRESAIESYLLQRTALHRHGAEFEALEDQLRQDVLTEVAKQALIQRAVLASDLAADAVVKTSDVDQAIDEIEASFADAIGFGAKLAAWGLSREMFREVMALELKVAKVLDSVIERVEPVTDVECEIYFHMNGDKFLQPEMRKLRHILVTVNDDYVENRRGASLKRIGEVERLLARHSSDFETLAARYSECPTAMQGGLLGWVAAGQLYPSLEVAAWQLEAGSLSGIVESEIGFHIVQCDERRAAKRASFYEVKERLKEQLTLRNRQREQKRWLQQQVANLQLRKG